MNLIKHLHEAAHVKVFKDELSLMKIDFFDAIDDDEIDDDNLKVEFIGTYFNITKTSNGYKMERANDEVSLPYNRIINVVDKWNIHIENTHRMRIVDRHFTQPLLKKYIPDIIGWLSLTVTKKSTLAAFDMCKLEEGANVVFRDHVIDVFDVNILPLSKQRNISIVISSSSEDMSVINLEDLIHISVRQNIKFTLSLSNYKITTALQTILTQLHQDKNINKAIDSIIDTGLEDLL